MASVDNQKMCFLCLHSDFTVNRDLLLFSKIKKYLYIEVTKETINLCTLCIENIENFHRFYEKVKKIHKDWREVAELVKVELDKDNPVKCISQSQNSDIQNDRSSVMKKKKVIDCLVTSKCKITSKNHSMKPERRKCKFRLSKRLKTKWEYDKDKKTLNHEINQEEGKGEEIDITNLYDPNDTSSSENNKLKGEMEKNKNKKQSSLKMAVEESERALTEFYKNIACPVCIDGVTCATVAELGDHFRDNHPGQKCFLLCCEKQIDIEGKHGLKRHFKIHFNPESCSCDVCGKTLSSPRVLRLHKQLHIPEDERQFSCEECGKKFGGRNELYRHKFWVHSEQHSVCQICGKEYRKRASFESHMKQVHHAASNKKTFVCASCGKTYRSHASLIYHTQCVHSDNFTPEKKLCPDCGTWVRQTYMKKHKLRHHSGACAYECTMCDRGFKVLGDLRHHMVTHTDQRPFLCTFCEAAFKTKATLKTHLGQHTGANPVICPYCGKTISNSSNYIAHRRRMHLKEHQARLNASPKNSSPVPPEEMQHS